MSAIIFLIVQVLFRVQFVVLLLCLHYYLYKKSEWAVFSHASFENIAPATEVYTLGHGISWDDIVCVPLNVLDDSVKPMIIEKDIIQISFLICLKLPKKLKRIHYIPGSMEKKLGRERAMFLLPNQPEVTEKEE